MDAKTLYRTAVELATQVVETVTESDMSKPTPDTAWTVRDLLSHMMYELAWTTDVVNGRTLREVGEKYDGDLLKDDPVEEWHGYVDAALDAIETADDDSLVHLTYGEVTVREYLMQAGSDQAIHTWDLGEAIGFQVQYDDMFATALYDYAETQKATMRSSGLYAAEVPTDEDDDTQTKLLALYGRTYDW